ncbi:hypothetical protein IFR05_007386 [Cadophora sp. M221]|nr:hypothetical protein IFR05_007386 [Cadophora sp. M221]
MFTKDLTEETLWRISVIERSASALSLVGICFIISTFLLSRAFHKSINRLIFYASVGNVFTCIGTMISRSAIKGTAVTNLPLCKTQAFLIQMFMPADALWAFIMALNVYLTFYWRYRAAQLKSLEKYYIIFCYGLTFLLAFVLLWVRTEKRGDIYGNATLWCWISGDWDHYRMYLFYGPVWFFCVGTVLIYIRLFVTLVSNWRNISGFSRGSGSTLPSYNEPITGIRTTDISFQSEPANMQPDILLEDMPNRFLNQYPRPAVSTGRAYNCHITGGTNNGSPGPSSVHSPTSPHGTTFPADPKEKYTVNASAVPVIHAQPILSQRHNSHNADNALRIMGAVALFFFFIMLITWIPSSANRLFSVVHPKQVSLALEYAAACVLPMQGFWNCVIYIIISHEACAELWKNLKERRQWTAQNIGATIRDAFSDTPAARRPNSSRTSTAIGSSSRPFTPRVYQNEDDSITLLESIDPSRPTSSRPNTGRADFDRV